MCVSALWSFDRRVPSTSFHAGLIGCMCHCTGWNTTRSVLRLWALSSGGGRAQPRNAHHSPPTLYLIISCVYVLYTAIEICSALVDCIRSTASDYLFFACFDSREKFNPLFTKPVTLHY